jgi:hypothetical protein
MWRVIWRGLHQYWNVGRAIRIVSAIARSSPKGSDTITPSIFLIFWKQSRAAFGFLVSFTRHACCLRGRAQHNPSGFGQRLIISSRPDLANWSGKNPRFPMMTPMKLCKQKTLFSRSQNLYSAPATESS